MSDWLTRYTRQAPVTSLFTLIILLVYAATALQSRSLLNSLADSSLGNSWILWGPSVLSENLGPLRAVGSMLLHLDLGHLFVNLFLLVLMGREVEGFFGRGLYATILFAGGIGAAAAILWLDPLSPTAGASGALYALMAVFVTVCIRRGVDLRAPIVMILVNVGYTFVATSVSFWGHLGGLLTGVVMAVILLSRSHRVQQLGIAGVLFLVIGLVMGWKGIMIGGVPFQV
ncbi:rhomboid family intramembrane serine protease [Corynebacterium sp. A21]|uniref:rhomboid family intramembrane serine protease n=1 Tax=Corynebacterium sp. A21 TaxID=3457318 RepID=UPI003FD3F637